LQLNYEEKKNEKNRDLIGMKKLNLKNKLFKNNKIINQLMLMLINTIRHNLTITAYKGHITTRAGAVKG
jgi:hypothetical protein